MGVGLSKFLEFFSEFLASFDESGIFLFELIDVNFELFGLIYIILPLDFFDFDAFFLVSYKWQKWYIF
jgi:hypothetical protein